jgi:hypothetical protein
VDENVQTGATSPQTPGVVSQTGAVVPPASTVAGTGPAPIQPSPEEVRLTELIAKEVAKATEVHRTELLEASRKAQREIQSAKDRATAEVASAQRRARIAEATLTATQGKLKEVDPESMTSIELARVRAELEARTQMDGEEVTQRQQEEFRRQFKTSLEEVVVDLGVDVKDSRIDWAEDSTNYLEAQKRVLKSVGKIRKEQDNQVLQKEVERRSKEAEMKLRKSLGLDTVDVANPQGVPGVSSDDDFLRKLGNYELPMTKENLARYQKIMSGGR